MNFQQMIIDLTGMDIANASLLDESTAAAEAMMMAFKIKKSSKFTFCVQNTCHPQTLSVLKTRAKPLGIKIIFDKPNEDTFGCLIQNPDTYGEIADLDKLIQHNKQKDVLSIIAADIMSLVIMKSPRKFGADMVVGSSQRFGVPMGLGGPHAAFFGTGFEFKTNINLKYFNMPSQKRIDILRNLIAPKVLNFYPQFAKKLWFN